MIETVAEKALSLDAFAGGSERCGVVAFVAIKVGTTLGANDGLLNTISKRWRYPKRKAL